MRQLVYQAVVIAVVAVCSTAVDAQSTSTVTGIVTDQQGRAPCESELTGPSWTPDEQTLFLAVQHPGSARPVSQAAIALLLLEAAGVDGIGECRDSLRVP